MRRLLQLALVVASGVVASGGLATAQEKITVGMASGVNQVSSLVAEAKGYFKDEGLNVEIKPVPRGNLAVEAIVGGSMQFAEVSDVVFLTAIDKGINLRAVGAASRGFTGKVVASPELADVKTFEDLKGKRIGIQVGTGVHGVFLNLLAKQGLTEADFQISNVRVTDMPTAMASKGTFDAVLGWDPMMQRIVEGGFGEEVISAADIQEMAGITYPLLLVVEESYLNTHKDEVQHFVNAYSRAHKFIRDNPDEALDIYMGAIEKAGANLERNIVKTMMFEVDKFPGVRFIDSDWPELNSSVDGLKRSGAISKDIDPKAFSDPSFAAAADEKFK